jgi:hypothetical protein
MSKSFSLRASSKSFALRASLLAAAAVLPAFSAPALAASPTTYVSGKGTDAGDCSTMAAPCRTFAYAIGQTSPRGQMKAIDAAEFGPFNIDKSISVIGVPGASAGQSGPYDDIVVTAAITDTVSLTGLTIQGLANNGFIGVKVNSVGHLTVKDCELRNLKGNGITIAASGAPGGKTRYLIEDTTIAKVGGHGVLLSANTIVADGIINRVTVSGATYGGIVSEKFSYGDITDTVVTNNGYGFRAGPNGWIQLARSTATANVGAGLLIDPNAYAVYSAGNNFFHHNAPNISGGNPTLIQPK